MIRRQKWLSYGINQLVSSWHIITGKLLGSLLHQLSIVLLLKLKPTSYFTSFLDQKQMAPLTQTETRIQVVDLDTLVSLFPIWKVRVQDLRRKALHSRKTDWHCIVEFFSYNSEQTHTFGNLVETVVETTYWWQYEIIGLYPRPRWLYDRDFVE